MVSYIGLFLGQAFFPAPFLRVALVVTTALIVFSTFTSARLSTRIISSILFVIGTALLVIYNAAPLAWIAAGSHNAAIISLVLTVPLLGAILQFEPYKQHLSIVADRYVTSPYRFYVIATLLSSMVSALMNVASFHFLYQLLSRLAEKYPPAVFHHALLRGFLPNMVWSPNYISLALAIQYAGISWFAIAPTGIAVGLSGLVLGLLMGRLQFRHLKNTDTAKAREHQDESAFLQAKKRLIRLISQTALLLLMIIVLEYFTHKSALVIVPVIAFTGPFMLALLYRRTAVFRVQCAEFITIRLPYLHNELILFTAIGFFGYALGITDLPSYIPVSVARLGLDTAVSLFSVFVLTIFILSMVGVHPMITIAAIAASFPSGSIPLTDLQMAGVYVTGYLIYVALSPFSAVNMVFASVSKQDPLTIGLKQNFVFATIYTALAIGLFIIL
jgi:hypothetical protein